MSAEAYLIPGADARRAKTREVQEFLSLPFPTYCKKYLKIRTKADGIQPLELNAGQLKLLEHTEAQLQVRGYVRTILLKSRQWGGCLHPETPVLTANLQWRPISEIKIGDALVASDEHPEGCEPNSRKGGSRKMRTAVVEAVWHTTKATYKIILEDGSTVICSADHRWLSRKPSMTTAGWRSIGAAHNASKKAALKVGDSIRTVADVWGLPSLDDAWLSGMIDGEGSFNAKKKSGGSCLKISQCDGPVFDRMNAICERRGYGHHNQIDNPRESMFGKRPVNSVVVSNMRSLFRLMGLSRPTRFIGKQWWNERRMPDGGWREIVAIEPGPVMELIDIETSTGTFIANGWVSHNSTEIQAMAYRDVTCGPRGTKAFIMTHRRDTTSALFSMAKRFNDLMDHRFQPASTGGSATQLKFDKRDSMYTVGTAGAKSVGHGETIQFLHASEFALWPNANEHLDGIFQTVPTSGLGTKVFVESTARGMGNEFHRMYMGAAKGESDYWPLFVPWFWFPEYQARVTDSLILTPEEEILQEVIGLTDEQMAFRALKIDELGGGERGEAKFCQQYPTMPEDAFRTPTVGSYYSAIYVVRARKTRIEVPYGSRVMGIDPSHIGGDRFSVCFRQGRRARHVGEWRGMRTTESFGRCVKLIKDYQPEFVFVDQGGPGAGIADMLLEHSRELNCQVIPVDFGGSPDDDGRYSNKREEMYGRCKEWLEGDLPVQIDDRDDLQTDLTNPQFRYDNAGRVQPESKQTMCKAPRNLPSPDLLESLVLTFAFFVKSKDPERQIVGTIPDPRRTINWRAM